MKVAQWVRNYWDLDFYKGTVGLSEVIRVFHKGTISRILFFRFVALERNLSALVKVNRPSLLIDCCSVGPELLGSRFS